MAATANKFETLLTKLTANHHVVVNTDDGKKYPTVDGLIDQLRQAVFGGMEKGGGTGMKSRPPIDVAAMDLYQLIDKQVTVQWCDVFNRVPSVDKLEALLGEWAARVDDNDTVTHNGENIIAVEFLADLVRQIEQFLARRSSRTLTEPCPVCHERFVQRDDSGEQVQIDCLAWVEDEKGNSLAVQCLNPKCGARWERHELPAFAGKIGVSWRAKVEEKRYTGSARH